MTRMVIIIFTGMSLVLAWLTWFISLRDRRIHGLFRFISFECILLLILMVYSDWFRNPLAWHQLASWIFLLASLLIAIFGFTEYYRTGQPRDGMEQTVRLIDRGLFACIRHPLYLSLMLGGLGIMWKHPGWIEVLLSCVNILALYITAKVEEKEMLGSFGKDYAVYMDRTRMFIPYLW